MLEAAVVVAVADVVVAVVVGVATVVLVVSAAASATHSESVGLVVQSMHPVTVASAVQVTASLLLKRQAVSTETTARIVVAFILDFQILDCRWLPAVAFIGG